MKESNWF